MRSVSLLVVTGLFFAGMGSGCSMDGSMNAGRKKLDEPGMMPPAPLAPDLNSVSPSVGPTAGGTLLALAGQNFVVGAKVYIAELEATEVTVVSGTRLTARLPAKLGEWGKVPVEVENPDGQRVRRSDLFGYYASQLAFPVPQYEAEAGIDFKSLALVVGDFNGDQKLDVVSHNKNTRQVSIRLGDGAGGLGEPTVFLSGSGNITSFAARDFDGDQKLDLALVRDGRVDLLPGDGLGGFRMPVSHPLEVNSALVDVRDFNGDQRPDILATNGYSDSAWVLLNDGMGGFGPATKVSLGTRPGLAVVSDFNGDQKLDLVLAPWLDSNARLLLGDGMGGFGTPTVFPVGSKQYFVNAGDLNGDGKADLVFASNASNTVSMMLGDGMGGFSPAVSLGTFNAVIGVVMADLNRDTKLDLAITHGSTTSGSHALISVLLSDGMGGFAAAIESVVGRYPGNSGLPGVGDFNGDQYPDLVVPNSAVSLLLSNGKGSFEAASLYPTLSKPFESMIATDLNADQRPDVVIGYSDYMLPKMHLSIHLNDGSGGLLPGIPLLDLDAKDILSSVIAADLNDDQKVDLVLCAGDVYVLPGDGSGGFGPPIQSVVGVMARAMHAVDFNSDGKRDLILSDMRSTSVKLMLGDGTGRFGPARSFALTGSATAMAVGDINRDGNLDVAVTNTWNYSVSVLLGDGAGGFGTSTPHPSGTEPRSLKMADFNGDRLLDLAVANHKENYVTLLFGDGKGGFSVPSKLITGFNYELAVEDFNGDQRPDLAVANYYGVLVFLGDGKGGFSPGHSFASAGGALVTADFNLDTKPDLLLFGSRLALLANLSQ